MSGNVFGADEDRSPGIYPKPGQLPPQFTDFMVESCAMHSRSKGWLPAVTIRIATMDGSGIVGCMEANEAAIEVAHSILTACARAADDVKQGIADRTLP